MNTAYICTCIDPDYNEAAKKVPVMLIWGCWLPAFTLEKYLTRYLLPHRFGKGMMFSVQCTNSAGFFSLPIAWQRRSLHAEMFLVDIES